MEPVPTPPLERPGGTGGNIHDSNKGIKDRTESDSMRAVAPIEEGGVTLRARQEYALRHKFIPPSKLGAPVKYTDDMPMRIYDMLSHRDVIFTQKMIASRLYVGVATLKEWKHIYPDLAAAVAQGLAEQEGWLATLMAGGIKYSQSVYAVLKNLHDWSDKIEQRTTLDLTDAIRKQALGAKRVQWDKARPAQVAPPLQSSSTIAPPAPTNTIPLSAVPTGVQGAGI